MLGRARGGADAPKEEEAPRTSDKEFTTKAEYNRWIVRQENARSAEMTREEAKAGEDIIKERQRKHTAQGLSRQQAAMVQMKRASESLEAHRQQNLSHGRKVYEEVASWRVSAKSSADEWAARGKRMVAHVKETNATGEAVRQLADSKKAQAQATRKEDQEKEAEKDRLRKLREKDVATLAAKVRSETSDEAIDAAKRHFYEQRLASAQEAKAQSAVMSKERADKNSAFQKAQTARRVKAKSVRSNAGKAREALLTMRTQEAAALREKKKSLSEEHKARMQEDYMSKSAIVKSECCNPSHLVVPHRRPRPLCFRLAPTLMFATPIASGPCSQG